MSRHGGALVRFARTLVRSEAAAEEVVQDAWIAVLDALDRFEGLDGEETRALLELTDANQRVLLHRARARVRLAMERHVKGER